MIRLICAAVISVGLAAPASAQTVPLRVHTPDPTPSVIKSLPQ